MSEWDEAWSKFVEIHKAWELATDSYMDALWQIHAGDSSMQEQMPALTQRMAAAHEAFNEAAKQFSGVKKV